MDGAGTPRFPLGSLSVVVTSKAADGRTLEELVRAKGRGVSIACLIGSGREMPLTPGRHVHRGDTLHLVGPKRQVEKAALALGYANRPGHIPRGLWPMGAAAPPRCKSSSASSEIQ